MLFQADMAELVDALASGASVHKTWGFESLYPHHHLPGLANRTEWPAGPLPPEGCRAGSEASQRSWISTHLHFLTKAPGLHQVRPILGTGLRIFAEGDIWQRAALAAG